MTRFLSSRTLLRALLLGLSLAVALPALAQDGRRSGDREAREQPRQPRVGDSRPRQESANRPGARAQQSKSEREPARAAPPRQVQPAASGAAPARAQEPARRPRADATQRRGQPQAGTTAVNRQRATGQQHDRPIRRQQPATQREQQPAAPQAQRSGQPRRDSGDTTARRQVTQAAQPRRDVRAPGAQAQQPTRREIAAPARRDRAAGPRHGDGREAARRLDRSQQEARIRAERQRVEQFQRDRERQQRRIEQRNAERIRMLQQQRRMAQYRYQQQYYARLLEQQRRWRAGAHDYWNDPYYYTPVSHRYFFGGQWHQTNHHGAELMRQAVRHGYAEGLHAGRADREDGWRYDALGSHGYIDASYGYSGHYLSQEQYAYYFRQGFQRGYEDGYHSRQRYGHRNERGDYIVLATVLGAILGLQLLN